MQPLQTLDMGLYLGRLIRAADCFIILYVCTWNLLNSLLISLGCKTVSFCRVLGAVHKTTSFPQTNLSIISCTRFSGWTPRLSYSNERLYLNVAPLPLNLRSADIFITPTFWTGVVHLFTPFFPRRIFWVIQRHQHAGPDGQNNSTAPPLRSTWALAHRWARLPFFAMGGKHAVTHSRPGKTLVYGIR